MLTVKSLEVDQVDQASNQNGVEWRKMNITAKSSALFWGTAHTFLCKTASQYFNGPVGSIKSKKDPSSDRLGLL